MISPTIKLVALTIASTLAIGSAAILITEHETDFNCSNPQVLETLRRSKFNDAFFEDRIAPETLEETIEKVTFYLVRTMDKRPDGYTCSAVIHVPAWKSKETSADKGAIIPEMDAIRDYTVTFTHDGAFVLYLGEKPKKHH